MRNIMRPFSFLVLINLFFFAFLTKPEAYAQSMNARDLYEIQTSISHPTEAILFGSSKAPVTIIEFYDYNCSFCKKSFIALEKEQEAHAKEIRIYYVPLNLLGKTSGLAALAVSAAHKQGKFIPYHRKLVYSQEPISYNSLLQFAQDLNLNILQFKEDMDDLGAETYLNNNSMLFRQFFRTVPCFIFNNEAVAHSIGAKEFKDILKRHLQ